MKKIWSVGGSLYMSEKRAVKAARSYSPSFEVKVEVYTVTQEYNTTNFVAEFDRDKQLRAVLGELSTKEIKELNYKSDVESLISVMEKVNFPSYYINSIKSDKDKPNVVMDFIKENKVSFLSNSKDVEYYKALIKLTGFSILSKKEKETVYFNYDAYRKLRNFTNIVPYTQINKKEGEDIKPAYPGADYGYRYVEQINLDESYHKAFAQAKKELKDDKR